MTADTLTAVAAIVAAVTGIWSVWLQTRGKRDRYSVGLAAIAPTVEQETIMHVVNLGDHPVRLKDWGFIEPDGTFFSIPLAWETMDLSSEEIEARGSHQLSKRNDSFESGYVRRKFPLGAYAISITEKRPRIHFDTDTSVTQRVTIWLRLLFQPNYLAW